MTRGKIGHGLLGCGLAGILAAMAAPAVAATNLNGALLEKLTSSGFVATWAPQPNVGVYDTSSLQYPDGWIAQGVATISATNAWAVGSYLDRKGTGHAGTEHFDGRWDNIANPGVSAASGAVFASGVQRPDEGG
jgi:hypothetical protein